MDDYFSNVIPYNVKSVNPSPERRKSLINVGSSGDSKSIKDYDNSGERNSFAAQQNQIKQNEIKVLHSYKDKKSHKKSPKKSPKKASKFFQKKTVNSNVSCNYVKHAFNK